MEAVDGVSLRELLREHGSTGPEAALAVLKGSLSGLAAAHHTGLVHRDYKPENVLVQADGTSKLVDFGIAVQAGEIDRPAGTPPYMAPEQWTGGPPSPATRRLRGDRRLLRVPDRAPAVPGDRAGRADAPAPERADPGGGGARGRSGR